MCATHVPSMGQFRRTWAWIDRHGGRPAASTPSFALGAKAPWGAFMSVPEFMNSRLGRPLAA